MPRIWNNFGEGYLLVIRYLLFVMGGKVKSTNLSWVRVGLSWVGLEFDNNNTRSNYCPCDRLAISLPPKWNALIFIKTHKQGFTEVRPISQLQTLKIITK